MLNYALTLEHLEATFCVRGLRRFNKRDFRSSNLFRGSGNLLRPTVYENFRRICDHEVQHVETLKGVIRSLGGRPVPAGNYNFNKTAFTSVEKSIAVAQFLENTGVKAYDGAIAHIERAALLTAGATIATVEARHASYLNLINGDVPFPGPSTRRWRRGRSARRSRLKTAGSSSRARSCTDLTPTSTRCASVCPPSRRLNVCDRSEDSGAGAKVRPDNARDENVGFY